MYIVNISFFVEPSAHEQWLELIKNKFIPFLRESNFSIVAFSRVISIEPVEEFTYSLLVEAPDMDAYNRLGGEILDEYKEIASSLFGGDVAWLITLLKRI